MSKLRIPAMALAAMVAANAVVPLAGRADETKTSTAALKHRWTFNTDLKDSVTGRSAVKVGANVAVADGVAKLTGNAHGGGSLNLGQGIVPAGAATIEIWATQTAVRKYGRIFEYGQNSQNFACMTWTHGTGGTDINAANVQVRRGNTVLFTSNDTSAPYTLNTKYHISMTFTPKSDGSCDIRWAKRNASTGAVEASGSANAADWSPGILYRPTFYLGYSIVNTSDFDAHAEYDEVRIWNGALTDAQLNANAAAGPNSLPETVAVAKARTARRTECPTTACRGRCS